MAPWQLALLVAALLGLALPATGLTIYVSPSGNDACSGRMAQGGAPDGPLATLTAARDAIRTLKAAGPLAEPVTVEIAPGTYRLTEPLVLDERDSGTAECPITWTGAAGQEPLISGGVPVTGWRQEGKLWVASVPGVGEWYPEAFWVNGRRAVRARTPNSGYYYTADKAAPVKDPATGKEVDRSRTAFRYQPGDLQNWHNLADVTVVVYHSWEVSLHHIARLEDDNTVNFTGPAAWPFEYWGPKQRYHVENVREALDEPGEWYLDRQTGLLSYMPRPGESIDTVEAVLPVARQLIVVEGDGPTGKTVSDITFRHLRLMHTDWPIGPQGHTDGQAAASVPAAVQLTAARHCAVERCEIAHAGTYAVWFRRGSQDCRAFHNELWDLGAGGVRLGEGSLPAHPADAASRCEVDNNFIHDAGQVYQGAVGVWIGQSSHHRVSHNEICDQNYTAVSVGWSWGYAPSSANHNVIEFNHLHHLGRGVLSDMGGIYSLGISPGTVERYNLIHDVTCFLYGAWGLYTDEGSSGIVLENNICYNTSTGGFHQHYGENNLVRNNIFAFARDGELQRSRPEEHISFTFERNIVVTNGGRLFHGNWGNGWYRIDRNLYWDYDNPAPPFFELTFAEWQAKGRDRHSLLADPRFADWRKRDFRLQPDSPALELGFRPIDTSRIGLYGESWWVAKPRQIVRPEDRPAKRPPFVLDEDFESLAVGEKAPRAVTSEEEGATIRVTDETAAAGRHSLKLVDRPGLQHDFNPHLYYSPGYYRGTGRGSFDLRLEPGARLWHEWRDGRTPYRVGPSFIVAGDGRVLVDDEVVARVEPGVWYHYEVSCPLGQAARGKWSLRITPTAGGQAQTPAGLTCDRGFDSLSWIGWVAEGQQAGVLYLDNLKLQASR